MDEKKKYRIGALTAMAMIAMALVFDGFEAILTVGLVGLILNYFSLGTKWVLLGLWMGKHGVSFTKFNGRHARRRAITLLGGILAGAIPIINALPEFTVAVAVIIIFSRIEDRVGVNPSTLFAIRTAFRKKSRQLARRKKQKERKASGINGEGRTFSRERSLRKAA